MQDMFEGVSAIPILEGYSKNFKFHNVYYWSWDWQDETNEQLDSYAYYSSPLVSSAIYIYWGFLRDTWGPIGLIFNFFFCSVWLCINTDLTVLNLGFFSVYILFSILLYNIFFWKSVLSAEKFN